MSHRSFLPPIRCPLARVLMIWWFGGLTALARAGGANPQDASSQPIGGTPPAVVRTDWYGDPLPQGAVARQGTIRFRHVGLRALDFSPDGTRLYSAGRETARVWNLATGQEMQRFVMPKADFYGMLLSPDGNTLFGFEYWATVHVWDVNGRRPPRSFGIPSPQEALTGWALAPDGRTLATAGHDFARRPQIHIRLWNVATGRQLRLLKGHTAQVGALAFSPDGTELASVASDNTVRIWDAARGTEKARFPFHFPFVGHGGQYPMAYSPDGSALAVGGPDRCVHLLDAAIGKEIQHFGDQKRPVESLVFLPRGDVLATTGIWTMRLWQVATGKELHSQKKAGSVIAVSRDGQQLATGIFAIRLWDAATGRELHPTGGHKSGIWSLAFSPDGRMLVTGGTFTCRFWGAKTGKELEHIQGHQHDVAFSPDGKLFVTAGVDGILRLWDAVRRKVIRHFMLRASALAFSADGQTLATAQPNGSIRLWDMRTAREVRRWPTPQKKIHSLSFTPDGKRLASANLVERDAYIWDTGTGKEASRIKGVRGQIGCAIFSPDGNLLATAGFADSIRLWDVGTGRMLRELGTAEDRTGATRHVLRIAFSPDGRSLFSAEGDGLLRVWEVATGGLRHAYAGHQGHVLSLGVSADGRRLATGSVDTTALIWEPAGRPNADLSAAWRRLGQANPEAAYQAVLDLSVSGAQSVAILRAHLHPARVPPPDQVTRWLRGLDAKKFAARQRAAAQLADAGDMVEPVFRKALQAPRSAEQKRHVEALLKEINASRLANGRALEVLERLNGPKARRLVQELAGGAPEAWLTHQAKATWDRLQRRPHSAGTERGHG